MKINLHPPLAIHEIGTRENNEDCIYPTVDAIQNTLPNKLFMVCDGVGGAAKGEEASKMVCEVLSTQLKNQKFVDAAAIKEALILAEQQMDNYISGNENAQGMATTLTLLSFHEKGATLAHLGDSRIYQIRGEQILFKTFDHSFVNELVAKNIISEMEASNHPKRNVVTKAIMGTQNHHEPEVAYLNDIQAGDYFFLCTDGVLESVSDLDLVKILRQQSWSNQEKMAAVKKQCSEYSKDNFSAYLLQVENVRTGDVLDTFNIWVGENRSVVINALLVVFAISIWMLFFQVSNDANVKEEKNVVEEHINSSLMILKDLDTSEIVNSPEDSMSQERSFENETMNKTVLDSIVEDKGNE